MTRRETCRPHLLADYEHDFAFTSRAASETEPNPCFKNQFSIDTHRALASDSAGEQEKPRVITLEIPQLDWLPQLMPVNRNVCSDHSIRAAGVTNDLRLWRTNCEASLYLSRVRGGVLFLGMGIGAGMGVRTYVG